MDGGVVLVSRKTQLCTNKNQWCEVAYTVYPPTDMCANEGCPNKNPLKKETSRHVLIYMVAHGVQPAWEVHVYCTQMYLSLLNPYDWSYSIPWLLEIVKWPTITTSVYGKVNELTTLESQTFFKSVNSSLLRTLLSICGRASSFLDGKAHRLSYRHLNLMDSTYNVY